MAELNTLSQFFDLFSTGVSASTGVDGAPGKSGQGQTVDGQETGQFSQVVDQASAQNSANAGAQHDSQNGQNQPSPGSSNGFTAEDAKLLHQIRSFLLEKAEAGQTLPQGIDEVAADDPLLASFPELKDLINSLQTISAGNGEGNISAALTNNQGQIGQTELDALAINESTEEAVDNSGSIEATDEVTNITQNHVTPSELDSTEASEAFVDFPIAPDVQSEQQTESVDISPAATDDIEQASSLLAEEVVTQTPESAGQAFEETGLEDKPEQQIAAHGAVNANVASHANERAHTATSEAAASQVDRWSTQGSGQTNTGQSTQATSQTATQGTDADTTDQDGDTDNSGGSDQNRQQNTAGQNNGHAQSETSKNAQATPNQTTNTTTQPANTTAQAGPNSGTPLPPGLNVAAEHIPAKLEALVPLTPERISNWFETASGVIGEGLTGLDSSRPTLDTGMFGGRPNQALTTQALRQMNLEVTKNIADGQSDFTVKLNPNELGRVTVKLQFIAGETVRAQIIAQNPETLELIQRDRGSLERAVEAGGHKLDSGNLSFGLEKDDQQSAGRALAEAMQQEKMRDELAARSAAGHGAESDDEQAGTEVDVPLEDILPYVTPETGLDIRV